jgi:hypothetical protein
MIAFLNTHHRELEAQPLSLAIESDDGLARVEQVLQKIAAQRVAETAA